MDPKTELAALEAQIAEAEAANKAARAEDALRDRIAEAKEKLLSERNAARDLPELAKLEGARGTDFEIVICRLGAVAVKKPAPVQWKRFQESKLPARDAAEQLVRACLVYPDAGAFGAILDDQPAAIEAFALACAKLAGSDVERLTGKS